MKLFFALLGLVVFAQLRADEPRTFVGQVKQGDEVKDAFVIGFSDGQFEQLVTQDDDGTFWIRADDLLELFLEPEATDGNESRPSCCR